MTLSQKLKQIRTLNNCTQQEFANLLGIDHATFQKYETETIPPRLEWLQKICKKFPEHTLWLMIDDIGIQQYIPALKEQEVRMNSHQQLENILQYNRDGSYGTQAARADVLHQLINDLHQHGYSAFKLDKIGSRHIEAAVKDWQSKGLSHATMANRLSHCRWLSQKLNKQNIVPRTNKELGINRRSSVAETDKSNELPDPQAMHNFTPREQLSMQLARVFGLRREESMKFNVNQADKGNRIALKGSWCKGGKHRHLKVRTQAQRTLLNKIKALTPRGSLIEKDKTYIQAVRIFEKRCRDNHLKMHGLRHAYALDRYKELTGRHAPVRSDEPTPRDKIDLAARVVIAKELGHHRVEITNNYLGL